jgi:hypothetical protein
VGDPLTDEIARLADGVAALRTVKGLIERRREMSTQRIADKLKAAGQVTKRVTDNIEQRADALIAREADINKKTEAAFAPHDAILDEHHKGLDELENSLRLLSNDPLPPGASSDPTKPGGGAR